MIWTIPNILTMARIVAAPCVALVFVVFDRPLADFLAFWLFVGAALTDFLDGWLARKLNQMSDVGKMLDPIADKAMVIIALMVLVARPGTVVDSGTATYLAADATGLAILVPSALIVLREVMVSGLREFLGDVKLPVTSVAKWKTTTQMVAIGVLLAAPLIWSDMGLPGMPGHHEEHTGIEHFGMMSDIATITGLALLWLAAGLTILSGWDYFRKGLTHIQAREAD